MNRKRLISLMILPILLAAAPAFAAEKQTTVTGEVIDSACYIRMGAKGPGHAQCAETCAKGGVPLAILEDKTEKVWMVAPEEDGHSANDILLPYVAKKVTITGTVYERGGQKLLVIGTVKAAQ